MSEYFHFYYHRNSLLLVPSTAASWMLAEESWFWQGDKVYDQYQWNECFWWGMWTKTTSNELLYFIATARKIHILNIVDFCPVDFYRTWNALINAIAPGNNICDMSANYNILLLRRSYGFIGAILTSEKQNINIKSLTFRAHIHVCLCMTNGLHSKS